MSNKPGNHDTAGAGAEQLWQQWSQWQNMWAQNMMPGAAPMSSTAMPGQQMFDPEQIRRQIDQLSHVEQWLNWQLQALAQSKQVLKMQADALEMLSPGKKKS
ncbi:MAG: hypothetical protein RLZZ502_1704 [Pseudomonadota bacterium]|jgi:hypothetical protein